jgi:hypothetical protein
LLARDERRWFCRACIAALRGKNHHRLSIMNAPLQPWKMLSASVQAGILTPDWNLAEPPTPGSGEARVFRLPVNFANHFTETPVVLAGLTGFDFDQRDSNRLAIRAADVSTSGFMAEITTWSDTRVYSVEFNWLAVGA